MHRRTPKPPVAARLKRTIAERADGRCEYCCSVAEYATESFAIEHIIPLSRGGTSTIDNLAFTCFGCNGHKYNKVTAPDPIDGQLVLLFHPRREQWQDHFSWSTDFTRVIGLTPTGRATVEALRLNRLGVVNLRRLLILIGRHPPTAR
jgi:5-methylcytosine-specific restriction endonuclease McrA